MKFSGARVNWGVGSVGKEEVGSFRMTEMRELSQHHGTIEQAKGRSLLLSNRATFNVFERSATNKPSLFRK